jgi:hypothetical protein
MVHAAVSAFGVQVCLGPGGPATKGVAEPQMCSCHIHRNIVAFLLNMQRLYPALLLDACGFVLRLVLKAASLDQQG